MIFDRIPAESSHRTMLRCSNSPDVRVPSPAGSEISVGSPSPPPQLIPAATINDSIRTQDIRNLRRTSRIPSPPDVDSTPTRESSDLVRHQLPNRKSSAERVKSFSIADILGQNDSKLSTQVSSSPPPVLALPQNINPIDEQRQRLLLDASTLTNVVRPWDGVHGPIPIRPFFPPVLLQYDQRLALDYQRQLQEHFTAQAQLLRQMSMDPTIIPSEDGSERSRSSSAASDCCSPEISGSMRSAIDTKSTNDGDATTTSCCSKIEPGNDSNPSASKPPANDTPLNALFQLSTKNFDDEQDSSHLNLFATRPNPKKKRKSRTAFTNHQIFQLEKRFLYQKYLSPANRDEIAAELGLSNAQVITWFQNRRAKLKRDMEELKKDVESVKTLSAYKSFLENVNDLSILKKRPISKDATSDNDEHFEPESQPTADAGSSFSNCSVIRG